MKNRRDLLSQLLPWQALLLLDSELARRQVSAKASFQKKVRWPLAEGPHTPKMVMGCALNADVKTMRRLKQIGVNHVSTVGGPGPWKEEELRGYRLL